MLKRFKLILIIIFVFVLNVTAQELQKGPVDMNKKIKVFNVLKGNLEEVEKVQKNDEEWKKNLTDEQFRITRKKGTERAFTGQYWNHKKKGIYKCVVCGNDLFVSQTKFDSGTGWPSFWQPVHENNISLESDNSFFMQRVEVLCSRCKSHLGHVFDDGPAPTHKRFCINSEALFFKPASE